MINTDLTQRYTVIRTADIRCKESHQFKYHHLSSTSFPTPLTTRVHLFEAYGQKNGLKTINIMINSNFLISQTF